MKFIGKLCRFFVLRKKKKRNKSRCVWSRMPTSVCERCDAKINTGHPVQRFFNKNSADRRIFVYNFKTYA